MAQAKTTFLSDYTPPLFLIEKVDLHFSLDESLTKVKSYLTILRNPDVKDQTSPLILNGEELELISIKLNDIVLSESEYTLSISELKIISVPNKFSLTIETHIKPSANTALSGLYVSRNIFCTQCEAEGFRRITYFLDRPDVLSSYKTTIVADKTRYPVLLSNGNKVATEVLENNQHAITWEDPFKKPSYLFALVAGDLDFIEDKFDTQSGRKITLQIFFEKNQKEKCWHAMDSLKKAMSWDEQVYGREYDLDIFMIAVIDDFNMGAMENKGLNIFNAQTILADPKSATDADYSYVKKVIGHEYFHNWTGNRITCRDWFQLSLKEGLTVFREQEFSEMTGAAAIERINTVKLLRSLQFAEDAGPLAHPVQPHSYIEINNFYTMTIYEKGAELIRMMKVLLGAKLFRKGMDVYFETHDGQAATIEDFIQSIEKGSGYDLQQFRLWYTQSGTPKLHIQYDYKSETNTFNLSVAQSCPPTPDQPEKKPFYIPLLVALLNPQGQTCTLQLAGESESVAKERLLIIKEKEQHFQFINIDSKPVPSLCRNFSAPVKLCVEYSDEELVLLMHNDNDAFNRWDALQQLVSRIVMGGLEQPLIADKLVNLLIQYYKKLLTNITQDNDALVAELLNLPTEAYFSEQMKIIDVDGIYRIRRWLREKIASALRDEMLKIYKNYQDFKPYTFNTTEQARRRVKNTCLSYLMLLKDTTINNLAITQYQKADNITDQVSALSELVNNNLSESTQLLDDFYQKNQGNTLTVCKWLAIQARTPTDYTLQRVKELLKHPAFDWKNPNKIRSLVGVFCSENQVQFHQLSGQGYLFLSEQIQHLDKLNSQIAARLLTPLTRWQRFDNIRSKLMREQLEQIVSLPNVSADVYEIASKSLASKQF